MRYILIADDNPADQAILKMFFTKYLARRAITSHQLICCKDGEELLTQFKTLSGKVDLIISDTQMSSDANKNGPAAIRAIRALPEGAACPIIGSSSEKGNIEPMCLAGANYFFTKPLFNSQLRTITDIFANTVLSFTSTYTSNPNNTMRFSSYPYFYSAAPITGPTENTHAEETAAQTKAHKTASFTLRVQYFGCHH